MARRQRIKNYWDNRKERFATGPQARSRAGVLREHEHVENVHLDKEGDEYVVTFSIAKWYAQALKDAGVTL